MPGQASTSVRMPRCITCTGAQAKGRWESPWSAPMPRLNKTLFVLCRCPSVSLLFLLFKWFVCIPLMLPCSVTCLGPDAEQRKQQRRWPPCICSLQQPRRLGSRHQAAQRPHRGQHQVLQRQIGEGGAGRLPSSLLTRNPGCKGHSGEASANRRQDGKPATDQAARLPGTHP